jgi:hypothetical protein
MAKTQHYSPPTTEFETQHSSAQNFSAPHDIAYVPSPQQQAPPPHDVSPALHHNTASIVTCYNLSHLHRFNKAL